MFERFARSAIEQSIPARFAEQVELHGARVAIRDATFELTYAELGRAARRVAAAVRAQCPGPPGAVALALPQGVALIVSVLGTLEAGQWYVTVDVTAERSSNAPNATAIRRGLLRAEATLVLADARTADAAAEAADGICPVVIVDPLASTPVPSLAFHRVGAETTAYVYFTSGTSGRPKGVMDCHRNVLHNVMRYTNTLQLSCNDRLSLLQPSTFSGAVSSMFGALLNGATLLSYDLAAGGAGAALCRWMHAQAPTVFHSVPSVFRSLCFEEASYPGVRLVRLEGDMAVPRDVELLRRHFPPDCVLVNGLGTTETGICRQYFVRPGMAVPRGVLPVGGPVEDMDVSVLTGAGALAGPGEAGEIVVRSRYLATGYWRDEARTRDAFVPDPADPALRTYRTGDSGRMLEDGTLEHLGRRDDRVKVYGEWLHFPTLEAAIASEPSVREAAVAARRSGAGEVELEAFVVPRDGRLPALNEIRRRLAPDLPAHFLPSRAYRLDALPLGSNAKLDRRGLLALSAAALPATAAYEPPRTELEHLLAGIWAAELGLERVGVRDVFVELGGDSLAAARIALEVERRLGRSISLVELVRAETIESLADVVAKSGRAASAATVLPVQPNGTRTPLFCVHDTESDAFLFAQLAHHLDPDQPVFGVRLQPGGPRADVPDSIEALASRYIEDLRLVQPAGAVRLAGFCFGAVVALEMAKQLHASGAPVERLVLINVSPYDLPGLASSAARRRFRLDLIARLRYLWRKPHRRAWLRRRIARVAEHAAWRLRGRREGDRAASARWVRSALHRAFCGHEATPFAGRATLLLAANNLELYSSDPQAAWIALARDGVDVHIFPHDGYAMLAEPDVRRAASLLDSLLDDPPEESTSTASSASRPAANPPPAPVQP